MTNVLLSSIVLSPFVLSLALVGALSGDGLADGGSKGNQDAVETASGDHFFALDQIDDVEIDMVAGDLTLRGGASDQIAVRVLDSHTSPACHFEVRQDGRTVEIESELRGLPGRCDFDLELIVPGPTPVEIDLGAGDVALDGLAGNLELDVGAGDVTGSVTGAEVDVSTGAGNVALSRLISAVKASTGTGDVSLTFDAAPAGTVEASTGVGDVEVSMPAGAVVDASASTGLGNVRQALTEQDGAATVVRASTGVGDVSLTGR